MQSAATGCCGFVGYTVTIGTLMGALSAHGFLFDLALEITFDDSFFPPKKCAAA